MTVKTCITQHVRDHLSKLSGQSKEQKDEFSKIKINEAYKFTFDNSSGRKISCGVIYIPYSFKVKNIDPVGEYTNKLSKDENMYFFAIAQRNIISEKSDYKQKIPFSRTLTSVYDEILNDLVIPAEIIGKRIRVNGSGKSILKIILENSSQEYFKEYRQEVVELLYKELTGRRLEISFGQQPDYIIFSKKSKKVKKTVASKKPKAKQGKKVEDKKLDMI